MFIPLCERGKSVSEVICEGAIMFIPLCERGKSVSEVICEGAIMFIPLCKRGKRGGFKKRDFRMKMLFLTTRLPFPPVGGGKPRAFNFLKYFLRAWAIT